MLSSIPGFSVSRQERIPRNNSGSSIARSIESSPPRRSPASSPGRPSRRWVGSSHSRDASVERISGPPSASNPSTPKSEGHIEPTTSLFDRIKAHRRPWSSSPRKYAMVPEAQTESYYRTFTRVQKAVGPLSKNITHEVLVMGAELLKFSPIPGLEGAAKVLLGIWDAVEQIEQPSYRRYFKRDEILEEISTCGIKLQDCYSHFDVCGFRHGIPMTRSIQLRILEYVSGAKQSPGGRDMSLRSKEEIHESIRKVQERQNELDRNYDLEDEQNYSKALRSEERVEEVLQVEKVDIPDAIKTFLRALESLRSTNAFEKASTSHSPPHRSSTWPFSHADANFLLRLRDRETLEKDIRSLKAAYGGLVPTLPSWTITKFEIDLGEMIGRGFFSSVYKGKWATHVVAIKVLEVHTTKESFVHEVSIWKRLSHPNVLELYGASSAEGSLPWFLVSPLMTHGSVTDYLKRIHWDSQRHKESAEPSSGKTTGKIDYLGMMYDIAEGMRYLHEADIYHGDLKVWFFASSHSPFLTYA
ncbi:hypothetical protein H0H87_012256 [Tephrocybe sp. NHM501043]|nr:hypothetical protein H0H87_012256 [Tephrocybe sp. NHM501043]